MNKLTFEPMRVRLPRRAKIKEILDQNGIKVLSPNVDMSDEQEVLRHCQEIAEKTGLSYDELASYFYSLAFEANPAPKSILQEFAEEFAERVYTEPRSSVRQFYK